MDQLNCNQDRLYQSLEAKMMKRDIFACWRDYLMSPVIMEHQVQN